MINYFKAEWRKTKKSTDYTDWNIIYRPIFIHWFRKLFFKSSDID